MFFCSLYNNNFFLKVCFCTNISFSFGAARSLPSVLDGCCKSLQAAPRHSADGTKLFPPFTANISLHAPAAPEGKAEPEQETHTLLFL